MVGGFYTNSKAIQKKAALPMAFIKRNSSALIHTAVMGQIKHAQNRNRNLSTTRSIFDILFKHTRAKR